MRKIFLTFVILLLAITNLFCLNNYGAKLGVNFSSVIGDDMPNTKYKINFSLGVFTDIFLHNWLCLQPELLLSARGADYDGTEKFTIDEDNDGQFDEDPFDFLDNDHDGYIDEDTPELPFDVDGYFQTYYLDLPVLLKANIPQISKQKISVLFGPSFNILLSGKYKLEHGGKNYTGDLSDLNKIDLAGVLGLEYSMDNFQLEFRVTQSLVEDKYQSVCETLEENYPEIYNGEIIRHNKIKGYNTTFVLFLSKKF